MWQLLLSIYHVKNSSQIIFVQKVTVSMVLTTSRVFAIPGTLGGPATLIMTTAPRLLVFMVINILFHKRADFIKLNHKTQLTVLFLIINELSGKIFEPRLFSVFYYSLNISFLHFVQKNFIIYSCSPSFPCVRAWRQRKVRTSLV